MFGLAYIQLWDKCNIGCLSFIRGPRLNTMVIIHSYISFGGKRGILPNDKNCEKEFPFSFLTDWVFFLKAQ